MTVVAGVIAPTPVAQWRALRGASRRARRALVSAWTGFFVDMVDIYLPVIALGPAIAYFQPATMTAAQASLLFYTAFAATLIGRPLGAVVFGHLADTLGRRRLTLVSIAGFSACTTLIGLLPGYAQIGFAAPLLLVFLRLVDGVFLGGEYTAATPLAFEHCPPAARGLFGGLLMGAYALAYAVISALVLLLLLVLPAGLYQSVGWRLPFLAGGALGFVFLAYRSRVPESDLWRRTPTEPAPIRALVAGRFRGDLSQVLLLMVGLWFVATSVVSIMPRLLRVDLGRPDVWVTAVLMVAQLLVLLAFVATGVTSQMVGRRRTFVVAASLSGTLGLGAYYLLVAGHHRAWTAGLLAVLTQVLVLAVWGVVTSYCAERFVTAVRSSGFGIAYSFAVIPASFYVVYLGLLDNVMPHRYTQLVLLALGVTLTVAGALLGPETVRTDLSAGAPDGTTEVPTVPIGGPVNGAMPRNR